MTTHTMALNEFVIFMDEHALSPEPVTLALRNADAVVISCKQLSTRVDLCLALSPKGKSPNRDDPFWISLPWQFQITFTV